MTGAVRGTQTLSRAVVLLKAVATRPQQGWRLTDLAGHCGYDKATAHRLLAGLLHERLVLQRPADRHYVPGPLLHELGLGVTPMAAFQARALPALGRLARSSRGVAFLYLRSGEEFVCAERVGNPALKGMSVDVGTRRPLLVSAAGVAILLALPDAEQARVLEANLRAIAPIGPARVKAVERMLRRSRRHGFGVNLADVVPGIHAFGVPLLDGDGQVFGSLSVVGPDTTLPRERMAEFEAMLRAEAERLAGDAAQVRYAASPPRIAP